MESKFNRRKIKQQPGIAWHFFGLVFGIINRPLQDQIFRSNLSKLSSFCSHTHVATVDIRRQIHDWRHWHVETFCARRLDRASV